MGRSQDRRHCDGCGTRLARDNRSGCCSPCSRQQVRATAAPTKPDEFWRRVALRDALDARHFGQLLYAYRHEHRPVLTQAKVGRWLGLTQGQVSRLERGEQPTHDLCKLDQWARALRVPEHYLWFQLSQPTRAYQRTDEAHSVEHDTDTGDEDVQRRQLLQALAAGAATAGSSAFGWFGTQQQPAPSARAVGIPDVQIIREMTQTFRALDNRFGGGRARSAVTNYLASDVVPILREGRYRSDVRQELSTAVAELNQLAGWMAYDVGDTGSGRRHLRQAMHLSQDVDGAYLAAKFGHCFRDLGRPGDAERFARRSLDMLDGYDRGRLFNLALLASALADQGKVEEACETGTAALRIAGDVRSVRTVAYLADLSHRITPYRSHQAVRRLNEQMRAAGVPVQ